jgi:hypothetical protein
MTLAVWNRRSLGISILFALTPVAFAIIRAIRTGDDFRYLWVALASLLSASIVTLAGNQDRRSPSDAAVRSMWVFVIATSVAVFVAWLVGVRVGPGSVIVGSAFGFCFAAGCGLYVLARPLMRD